MEFGQKFLVFLVGFAVMALLYYCHFDKQITDGRFNSYGSDPVVTTTTLPPTPAVIQPPPEPEMTLPEEPTYITPSEPRAPTPFDTGKKVRAPYGCEEGYDERGVDCK